MSSSSSSSTSGTLKFLGIWIVVPYLIGYLLSNVVVLPDAVQNWIDPLVEKISGRQLTETSDNEAVCERRFQALLGGDSSAVLDDVPVFVHRNGQPQACDQAQSQQGFVAELKKAYKDLSTDGNCPAALSKYQVEALLTIALQQMLSKCKSEEPGGKGRAGFYGFCDMGVKKTPILHDHDDLVRVNRGASLPCRFHTREGLRITNLNQLNELSNAAAKCRGNFDEACKEEVSSQVHLYAVPAGRVFMFAPSFVGEIFHLPHVPGAGNQPIYLEVISVKPRVFDVFNFFSREESQQLVDKAKEESSDSHKIKRSSTGASGYNLNSRRTSESGFDTHGKTAVKVKKRCFAALGFDEYVDSYSDGLQILRYNLTTAYNSHMDWIEDHSGQLEHDYESGGTGGNRFATILMYMSDLGEDHGGETVFPQGWPPYVDEADRVSKDNALEQLRASDKGGVLAHGSWEESLVAQCRSRLAIRPHSSRAVLFYSQHPNGQVDRSSLHGACPVLEGQKYAANLWVWNTPRAGYPGAPIKEKFRNSGASAPSGPQTILGHFRNTGKDPRMANAKLYYQKQFWADLGYGSKEVGANTYEGHVWNIQVDGKVIKSWTVKEKDGIEQQFYV